MNALGYPLHEAMSDARDWLSGTTFYEGMRGWKPCMAVLVAEIERFADECSVSIRDSTAGNVRTHSAAEWIGMSQENERLRALLEISEGDCILNKPTPKLGGFSQIYRNSISPGKGLKGPIVIFVPGGRDRHSRLAGQGITTKPPAVVLPAPSLACSQEHDLQILGVLPIKVTI